MAISIEGFACTRIVRENKQIKWPAFCINRRFFKLKTICSNDLHLRWDLGHVQSFKYLSPIYLPLLCSVASVSLSVGAVETSVHCMATPVS